jgi:hypothetical protein
LVVDGASYDYFGAGVLMTSVGALSLGAGLICFLLGAGATTFGAYAGGGTTPQENALGNAALILGASGLLVGSVGVFLVVRNKRTRVEQVVAPADERPSTRLKGEGPSPVLSAGGVLRWPLAPTATLFGVTFD